jgi:hypothetical protein
MGVLMDARKAYEAISKTIGADPRNRIIKCVFDKENFGNFIISFERGGAPRSVVNDRGQLVLCDDPEGRLGCRTVVQSLYGVDEQRVIQALKL